MGSGGSSSGIGGHKGVRLEQLGSGGQKGVCVRAEGGRWSCGVSWEQQGAGG